MNYITPEKILSNRFKDSTMPNWRYAMLCFRDVKGSKTLVDLLGAKPIERKILYGMEVSEDSPFVYEADMDGEKMIIVTRCLWGAPQAAILMEELIGLGAEYIIGYGAAGSINETLRRGEQIVAHSGLRTDGTSVMYKDASLSADKGMVEATLKAGQDLGIDVKEACLATVDVLYKESEELAEAWRKQGADAISMETSAFYAVLNEHDKKGIWIGHVSDCLVKKWEDWHEGREDMSLTTARICKRVIEILKRVGRANT